jgi:hypothetical protein
MLIVVCMNVVGCVTHYWSDNLVTMANENPGAPTPLARDVIWVLEEKNLDNPATLHGGTASGEESDVPLVLPQDVSITALDQLESERRRPGRAAGPPCRCDSHTDHVHDDSPVACQRR